MRCRRGGRPSCFPATQCHAEGKLYDGDAGGCKLALAVSCGTKIAAAAGRVEADCGGDHFAGNKCQVACAEGYAGKALEYVCGTDGQWISEIRPAPKCENVDECANPKSNDCDGTCTDTDGGYRCSCSDGFKLDEDGSSCFEIAKGALTFGGVKASTAAEDFEREWTVPAGWRRLKIEAHGAGGGSSNVYRGGAGARVTAEFDVTPGDTLVIVVGGTGTGFTTGAGVEPYQVPETYPHRKGGGLVGVFLGSGPFDGGRPLVVAGSGGGAGQNWGGGRGGDGGLVGEDAVYGTWDGDDAKSWTDPKTGKKYSETGICSGKGGGKTDGGAGGGMTSLGISAGKDGTAGARFVAGRNGAYGAFGGAGYYGGGGGGHCPNMCGCAGGGGSSFTSADAENVEVLTGKGSRPDTPGTILITPL